MSQSLESTVQPMTRLIGDLLIPCEGSGAVIESGVVDIDADGRISAVGTESDLGPTSATVQRVGGLLMPGLVNIHAHSPMSVLRSAGDGLPLDRWLAECVWPREGKMTPDDAHWSMTLGSIEMLLAGVTTTVESYFFEHEVVEAVRLTGQRMVMAAGILSAIAPETSQFEKRVSAVSDFVDANHEPNGRIHAGYAPHSTYDIEPGRLAVIAAAAIERDSLVTIHLEETQAERQVVLDRYGKSATQVLADSGMLETNMLAAHGVWLDDVDLKILGEADAGMAHCPQSNGKLGSGIANLPSMLDAGIRVGLGTDGPASNDNLDLWEELRLAPILARATSQNPEAMSSVTALNLATCEGARAIRMDDVGELRPGAWADIIRIDVDHPEFIVASNEDVISNLVWAGGARRVTDVWVAGSQVVADGECTTIDRHDAQRQVASRARTLIEK